jgi:hypothetical protein
LKRPVCGKVRWCPIESFSTPMTGRGQASECLWARQPDRSSSPCPWGRRRGMTNDSPVTPGAHVRRGRRPSIQATKRPDRPINQCIRGCRTTCSHRRGRRGWPLRGLSVAPSHPPSPLLHACCDRSGRAPSSAPSPPGPPIQKVLDTHLRRPTATCNSGSLLAPQAARGGGRRPRPQQAAAEGLRFGCARPPRLLLSRLPLLHTAHALRQGRRPPESRQARWLHKGGPIGVVGERMLVHVHGQMAAGGAAPRPDPLPNGRLLGAGRRLKPFEKEVLPPPPASPCNESVSPLPP